MRKGTTIYALTVGVLGIAAGIWSCYRFFVTFEAGSLVQILCLSALLILCRCLPLYIRDDFSIDMSFISILTIFLLQGPIAAAALYLLTSPFIVEPIPGKKGEYCHIFNTAPIKTLFNTGNLMISILLAGLCYRALGCTAGEVELTEVILPIILYMAAAMMTNVVLMAILFKLEADAPFKSTIVLGLGQFLPNIICAVPIGYFLALLAKMSSGPYLMLLFMFPLLLARYSFKMYLDIKNQQYKVITALSAAIEAKDPYTVGHSKRVEQYSELIARELRLSEKKIYTIKIAALFHDIGKIGIQDNILNKAGSLTDNERAEINRHPEISVHILEKIDFYGDIKDYILEHHERYDGGGYPNAVAGRELMLEAAIISVADAFDAMTSDRPYRKGFSPDKAIGIIEQESGKQFHPTAAKAAIAMYRRGALVLPEEDEE